MAWHNQSGYIPHNESLSEFVEKFNAIDNDNLLMIENRRETYSNDGSFLCSDEAIAIGFDWEMRQNFYESYGGFKYKTLKQFARKLVKPSIRISLQLSKDGTGLLVAWHDDFPTTFTEEQLKSDIGGTELTSSTELFTEYDVSTEAGIIEFKKMLTRAVRNRQYNSKSF